MITRGERWGERVVDAVLLTFSAALLVFGLVVIFL